MIVDGGTMRNISVSDIEMDDVRIPIFMRLGKRSRPALQGDPVPGIGIIENIQFSNITAIKAGYPCNITGLHERKIKGISLKNISIQFEGSYNGTPTPYNKVPLKEQSYPMGIIYGNNLPASAFYIRDVENIVFNNVKIGISGNDKRVPIVMDRVDNAEIANCSLSQSQTSGALVYLRNTKNVTINKSAGSSNTVVIREQKNCCGITLKPGGEPGIKTVLQLADPIYIVKKIKPPTFNITD
jgi:hypothetical protein